ncbi:uncharacterized protein At5g03900, chloroplastic-like [Impatiens glandulifera]|uniref:uncharacterized protein At5g03900, chloroplastic-like n=1 Tax=Impatiens glandulifera TaxID=253017 RepID=UPI001FB09989|nr:uncharacterized protein At5g03900, chloroplastic-like [Impatiens glandulifera]
MGRLGRGGVQKFFEEKKWQFSKTSSSEKAMVIGLGALNLFGVIVLDGMLKTVAVAPTGFISFVGTIFPWLQVYAASFFLIPLARWLLIRNKNAQIENRNSAREKFAQALNSPDYTLMRKLLSARDMAQRTFIGQDIIVYSTDKDLFEQEFDAQEWERKLNELEKLE